MYEIWGDMETNNKTDRTNNQSESYPASQRRCVIDGKRFIVTRHFAGDKDLGSILTEFAINHANKEMGL